mgnify:FL=1
MQYQISASGEETRNKGERGSIELRIHHPIVLLTIDGYHDTWVIIGHVDDDQTCQFLVHIHQVLQGVIMRNPTVPAFLYRIDGIAGIPGGIVGLIKPVVIEFLKIQSQS